MNAALDVLPTLLEYINMSFAVSHTHVLLVLCCGCKAQHNPKIDWTTNTVRFRKSTEEAIISANPFDVLEQWESGDESDGSADDFPTPVYAATNKD